MTERYRHHPDMDRSTAGDRIPIGDPPADVPWREKIADGVYRGINDSFVHLPPRPNRPTDFELALERRAAYWARKRVIHIRLWKAAGWVALVLGAVLMVAVTR